MQANVSSVHDPRTAVVSSPQGGRGASGAADGAGGEAEYPEGDADPKDFSAAPSGSAQGCAPDQRTERPMVMRIVNLASGMRRSTRERMGTDHCVAPQWTSGPSVRGQAVHDHCSVVCGLPQVGLIGPDADRLDRAQCGAPRAWAVRTLSRTWRLSVRRSSSLNPPQTPESCPVSSAQLRQSLVTAHRLQTAFASSTWRSAGPVVPIGKKSSGSSSRQSALWRQSMRTTPSLVSGHTAHQTLGEPPWLRRVPEENSGCLIGSRRPGLVRVHVCGPNCTCIHLGHSPPSHRNGQGRKNLHGPSRPVWPLPVRRGHKRTKDHPALRRPVVITSGSRGL